MNHLERLDHTADDFADDGDFAAPAEGPANERARWEAHSWERRARSDLYGTRSGTVTAAPINPPATAGGGADPTPTTEGAPMRQRRPQPPHQPR